MLILLPLAIASEDRIVDVVEKLRVVSRWTLEAPTDDAAVAAVYPINPHEPAAAPSSHWTADRADEILHLGAEGAAD
jgi:hypothetical protein